VLASLHALIVGCGGTGSILAEALGRAGIGALTVIDGDALEATNLNRWQGGEPWMVQKPKALLLGRRLRAMFPEMQVRYQARSVFHPSAEPLLRDADVLFGAVDADAPRLFLNRVALQHLVPYFDVGVAVTTDEDRAVDFRTRVFAVYPGTSACLECTGFALFDREEARRAFLDERTAAELRQAGYVTGQPDVVTPSVYALNRRSVGLVVTEFLNWVCGWRPAATVVSESWRHGTMQRADRGNFPEPPDPNCLLCGYLAGAGSTEPLPRPAAFAPAPRTPSPTSQGV
jgi:molybdopterin-synthase adenylyltransferase